MRKYIFLIIGIILLGGCSEEAVEPVEEDVIEAEGSQALVEERLTREEQTQVLKDYYGMISSNSSNEDIIKLVDENISKLDKDIVDEIVLSLEDHLSLSNKSIKYLSETLVKYKEYASEEIKSYLDILKREGEMVFTDGESMVVDLKDLIERGIKAENHLRTYPDGKTMNKVKNYYSAYIYAAIQGVGNQYIYAGEGTSKVREDVLNQYKEVVEDYPEFNIGKIFQLYIDTLALDKDDLNGESVLKFYEDLDVITKDTQF